MDRKQKLTELETVIDSAKDLEQLKDVLHGILDLIRDTDEFIEEICDS